MEVRRTRRPSWAMLLLYHWGFVSVSIQLVYEEGRRIARTTSSSTDGAEVPLLVLKISNGSHLPHGLFYSPRHHKGRKICYVKLLLHINRNVNTKANERKQEPSRHEREPESSEVARESQD